MKGLKIGMLALVLCGAFQVQGQSAGRVQIQADPRIEELLRLRVENNDDGRKVDGFVIQIYYGRKQQATRVLEAFREAYPMEHVEMEYAGLQGLRGGLPDPAAGAAGLGRVEAESGLFGCFRAGEKDHGVRLVSWNSQPVCRKARKGPEGAFAK